jgi:GNAT superfamily N-acetyltransferase
MGYYAERRRWGTYWNNAQVYTEGLALDEVEAFLADVREYYAGQAEDVYIHVDDRSVDAELGPALCAAGCVPGAAKLFLAHVGSPPPARPVPGLDLAPVDESNLRAFAETKLRALGSREDPPDPAGLEHEIARRRRELAETGRGRLARVAGQPAGVLWWHANPQDIWVNLVATRLPFRGRGVAGEMLRRCVEDAYGRGARCVVINVAADNLPALRLYRRLGFQDEVYWRPDYILEKGA